MPWRPAIRYASFWCGIALFVAVGVFSYRGIATLTESNRQVDHTQTVLAAIKDLRFLLIRCETAQRGYIIGNDPAYLQLYEDARARVPAGIERIRSLTRDNDAEQGRLGALEGLIAERLALLAGNLEQYRAHGFAGLDAAEFVRGRMLMSAVYRAIEDMSDEEERLYRNRADTAAKSARFATTIDAAGTIGGTIMIALLFVGMSREVRSRQRAEEGLRRFNNELEERVRARTSLLEAEIAERRRSDETLRAVIEEAPFAIIGLALDRHVTIWNRAAERIFGYSAVETLNRLYPLAPPAEGRAEADRIFDRSVAGERLRNVPVQRRRKDGVLIDVVVSAAPLYDAARALHGFVFVVEDITERKALEQQLRQAQKMEVIGQLTGGIAHDFNNLLAVIIGNLDLLKDRIVGDPDANELADEARAGAVNGAELTKRMLAFARRQPLQPKNIDLSETVSNITAMLRRTLGENIIISASLADDLWPALADPSQVEDAALNLAVNARDAMPHGGRLIIETANASLDEAYAAQHSEVVAGDYVMLAVTDSGMGMPADIIERVFEPFFTTKETGTGLGLSMVYGFVKQSGGHIKIYSEPGHGTTVKVYLPKGTTAASTDSNAGEIAKPPTGNEAVLIVEDNAKLRSVAIKLLRDLGYRVREADGAPAARAILAGSDDIDLLFTDIVMPNGTGYELAHEAKTRRPGLKVLLTSGYSKHFVSNDEAAALDARIIAKPYGKQDLAEKLRSVFDGTGR